MTAFTVECTCGLRPQKRLTQPVPPAPKPTCKHQPPPAINRGIATISRYSIDPSLPLPRTPIKSPLREGADPYAWGSQ